MTQLERYIDPPGRSPFSWTTMPAPSSRARTAAARPAIPAPATTRSGSSLDEREGRLVLDVLELDAVRAPDEDCVGVRRIDDVGDLQTAILRFPDVMVGRLDSQAEMVEQGPLGLLGLALLEVDVGVPGLQPSILDIEAELGELRERCLRIRDPERDVVEVVRDSVLCGDEREGDALRAYELDAA